MKKKNWREFPAEIFMGGNGYGKELPLIVSKYFNVTLQIFSAGSVVDIHSHKYQWELIAGLCGIVFAVYPPNYPHCLFGSSNRAWAKLSIKIGKKS